MTTKQLLSGNEAIARGAYEAGATVGTGYPGTPSTEILENFVRYPDVYCEWSVNEKVALEVAIGASLAGARTLVTMKHVGVNVAADPLFTLSYIGIKGGLVIVSADDPDMHSSQNEQDNRHYALAAKIPMLEPADSQEAKEFTKLAFKLSEKYDTPVFIRSVTRLAHTNSIVSHSKPTNRPLPQGFERNIKKYVMIPAFARLRHLEVEKRLALIAKESNELSINQTEINDKKTGFITSGVNYHYLKEIYPEATILKLGMIYPLPVEKIKKFCKIMKRVIIVEDLDPFLETLIKAMGITNVQGKKLFPLTGELNPDIIRGSLSTNKSSPVSINIDIPNRPPALCPGCPHRQVFNVLKKLKLTVSGDIGCYTLGVLPPFSAMDTCIDMGASIGVAQGIEIASNRKKKNTVVAVLGDSTFAHSGITGLLNAAYNGRHSLIIVLDNGTTAMTGMQPNPSSGETISGNPTIQIDYHKLGESMGLDQDNIREVNAYKEDEIEKNITKLLTSEKLSLLVIKGLCVIFKTRRIKQLKKGK
ncbi:MAG: thiamine pyrophosphate-dependent enzyme [Candidatus Margulisbacteria bacterium]|nr:thiamine pyrophosphate-dependent enzyme [Candidatus Margulisiibacteriota bacterium]